MALLYGITAALVIESDYRNREVITWPVLWRLSLADIQIALDTINAQQALFVEELHPIWQGLLDLQKTERAAGSASGDRFGRTKSKRGHQRLISELRKERRKLLDKEAAINARWSHEMLDALYPTSTNGEALKVDYQIITFCEDQRSDLSPADLIKMRAFLHGARSSDDSDGEYDEESELPF